MYSPHYIQVVQYLSIYSIIRMLWIYTAHITFRLYTVQYISCSGCIYSSHYIQVVYIKHALDSYTLYSSHPAIDISNVQPIPGSLKGYIFLRLFTVSEHSPLSAPHRIIVRGQDLNRGRMSQYISYRYQCITQS